MLKKITKTINTCIEDKNKWYTIQQIKKRAVARNN
jgi:hypothetical protein